MMVTLKGYFSLSTAKLRKELKDPKTTRDNRCKIYAELLRRKHYGREGGN